MTTLVFSDVHANAPALSRVLDAEPAADRVLFLGDAVDLGPHPDECVSRLRDVSAIPVIGNHDRIVLEVDDATSPGDRWLQWCRSTLSTPNRTYLESAPRTRVVALGGEPARLHHGDYESPDGFDGEWDSRATPNDAPEQFERLADRYDESVVLLGHSHLPFHATVAGTTFVNPGSVGHQRPGWRHDLARYAVYDDSGFRLEAIEYDVESVVNAYDDLPLPEHVRDFWKDEYTDS